MMRRSSRARLGRWAVVLALATWVGQGSLQAQDTTSYRLTLGDAARLAARNGLPVLQARARVDQADARVRQTTADLLPSVNGSLIRGARTFNTASFGLDFPTPAGEEPFFDPDGEVVGPVKNSEVRAGAEIPLLDLAALGRRRRDQASAGAAQQQSEAAEQRVAAGAARAYLGVLGAEALVAARQQDLELAKELVEIARGQIEAGVAVALDLTRAQAQQATVEAQLLSATHRAQVANLALLRTLNLPLATRVTLVDRIDSLPLEAAPVEEEAVAQALARRDDLGTAQAYRDAAAQSLRSVRAGRLPRITAAVDQGYYGKGFGHMLNTYTWSLRLSVPLFDGFQRTAEIQENEARIRELEYGVEDLEAEVAFQVREALLTLEAARRQAEAADEQLRLADLEVQQEEERIRAGAAGTADVVRAAMRLNDARTARLQALYSVHEARVSLAASMGTVVELP